jgi:predicted CXXCH cytochrome family protein
MSRRIPYRVVLPVLVACVTALASSVFLGGELRAQDTPRTSDECLACHEGKDATLAHTAHSLASRTKKGAEALIACTDCHQGNSKHWQEDPAANPMPVPAKLDARAEARVCSQCHQTLGQTRRALSRNGTNVCTNCHAEFQGPFPFEHPATLDFSTEEGGCLSCHAAHGSDNPRMLNQPYEPPHFQLCSQCHTVPRHNMNLEHGTRWQGVACNTCHSDIHGSYTSPNFLSESLASQGCFKVGCHGGH